MASAAVVVGTLVSLARQPGPGALDTAWDEDARVFLADAANRSTFDALIAPYEGYYHAVPRLLAEIALLFPPADAAAVMAIQAAVVTSLLGLFVYVACRAHLSPWPLRLLVSVPVVVLPFAQSEVPNALCNLHWPLLYASFWALLWTPARRSAQVVAVLVVALTVTSDLLAVAFLPLAAARFLLRRDVPGAALLATLLGGLGLQFAGLIVNDNPRDLAPPRLDPAWALTSFALRPVPQVLLGARLFPGDPKSMGYLALAAVAWLVVLGAVAVGLRRWTRPAWVLAAVSFAQAAALYSESLMAGGLALPRYAVAPGLMALAGVASLTRPPAKAAGGRRGKALMVALLALVGVVCAINVRVDNPRAEGPSWRESVRHARALCVGLPRNATVPTAVSPRMNATAAELSCGYLDR